MGEESLLRTCIGTFSKNRTSAIDSENFAPSRQDMLKRCFKRESRVLVAGIDLARLLWVRCGVLKATTPSSDEYKFSLSEKYLIAAPTKNGCMAEAMAHIRATRLRDFQAQ